VLVILVDGSPLSPIPKRGQSLSVVTLGDDIIESSQLEPPPPIVSPVFGAHGGIDVMVEAASFVWTVSITGRDSGVGVEIIAETEPPEGWVDRDATQTHPEGWVDEEDGEMGGQGVMEATRTQRSTRHSVLTMTMTMAVAETTQKWVLIHHRRHQNR